MIGKLARQIACLVFVVAFWTTKDCRGAEISVQATATGFFFQDSSVEHAGYFVGRSISGGVLLDARNYFVFKIPKLPDVAVAARLVIPNPAQGFGSADAFEEYSVFDVEAGASDIASRTSFQANFDVYDDLGSGSSYGQVAVDASINGSDVTIDLSPEALAAINAVSPEFAIGGAITSIVDQPLLADRRNEYIFGFSLTETVPTDVSLKLTIVPEPTCFLLTGVCSFGFLVMKRPN